MKKILSLIAITAISSSSSYAMTAKAVATPLNAIANKGTTVFLQAEHYAEVVNDTDQRKTIYVEYNICAENKDCDKTHRYRVFVNPQSTWHDTLLTNMEPIYWRTGRYQLTAETIITGDIQAHYTGHATITIN